MDRRHIRTCACACWCAACHASRESACTFQERDVVEVEPGAKPKPNADEELEFVVAFMETAPFWFRFWTPARSTWAATAVGGGCSRGVGTGAGAGVVMRAEGMSCGRASILEDITWLD